jgi:Iap family predicted aminopeptidase
MKSMRSNEKVHALLTRRQALLLAGTSALTVALGGCASGDGGSGEGSGSAVEEASSIIDEDMYNTVLDKIDRDYVYDLTKELSLIGNDDCELGFRNAGSTGETKCRQRIAQEMESIGLNVEQDSFPVHAWEFRSASLKLGDQEYTLSSFAGAPGTNGDIEAEIVDCGDGTAKNYEGKDLTGKIALTHFDNYNYWFMAPAYEAELAGAKAIIVETIGDNYNVGTDTLYCFDVAARDTIPVLCITKDDAAAVAEQIKGGETQATLNVDATIDKNGTSACVLGTIPGRDGTDQNITLGAHYDGYFHAFMDDVWGVCTELGIAKALIESGYQPEHNIIFIAFGSEEYGTTSNHYDWCTGVWNEINVCRPELVGKTICHLEMDSVRPDATKYIVNATPELHTWFKERLKGIEPPSDQYSDGVELAAQNGPWAQDYDMEIAGVPGLCAGKTNDSVWKTTCYHTSASSPENDWNEKVFSWISQHYLRMLMELDSCAVVPLDFSTISTEVNESFDSSLVSDADVAQSYKDAIDKMSELSQSHYALIDEANELVRQARADDIDISAEWDGLMDENAQLLAAYKIIQHDKMKLDIWDVVAYKCDIMQLNISSLNDAIAALEDGDGETALDSLFNVDTTYLAADFSKEVYEYTGIEALDPARTDLFWGTGKTMDQVNTYDAYHAIADKVDAGEDDFADEIEALKGLLATDNDLFVEAIKQDTEYVQQVNDILTSSTLEETVQSLRDTISE